MWYCFNMRVISGWFNFLVLVLVCHTIKLQLTCGIVLM